MLHPKLCTINPHNITRSLISRNPRERMLVVQISLLIVIFLCLISRIFVINANHQRSQPTPSHCAMCQYMEYSSSPPPPPPYATCWMLVHAYANLPGNAKWIGSHHRRWEENESKFRRVTCYTGYKVSLIHVNTTILHTITCTSVATCVILRSLECISQTQLVQFVTKGLSPHSLLWTHFWLVYGSLYNSF